MGRRGAIALVGLVFSAIAAVPVSPVAADNHQLCAVPIVSMCTQKDAGNGGSAGSGGGQQQQQQGGGGGGGGGASSSSSASSSASGASGSGGH